MTTDLVQIAFSSVEGVAVMKEEEGDVETMMEVVAEVAEVDTKIVMVEGVLRTDMVTEVEEVVEVEEAEGVHQLRINREDLRSLQTFSCKMQHVMQ